MSQLQLKQISKEIIKHAEEAVVPERGLPKVVDDYFIQRLKLDEMQHAEVDSRLYEGLRTMVKAEVLPLSEQFRLETARVRERPKSSAISTSMVPGHWEYVTRQQSDRVVYDWRTNARVGRRRTRPVLASGSRHRWA